MARDRGLIALEQIGHLVNRKPNGIPIKGSIDFGQAIFCGVDDDRIIGRVIWTIHFKHLVPGMQYSGRGDLTTVLGQALQEYYIMLQERYQQYLVDFRWLLMILCCLFPRPNQPLPSFLLAHEWSGVQCCAFPMK